MLVNMHVFYRPYTASSLRLFYYKIDEYYNNVAMGSSDWIHCCGVMFL